MWPVERLHLRLTFLCAAIARRTGSSRILKIDSRAKRLAATQQQHLNNNSGGVNQRTIQRPSSRRGIRDHSDSLVARMYIARSEIRRSVFLLEQRVWPASRDRPSLDALALYRLALLKLLSTIKYRRAGLHHAEVSKSGASAACGYSIPYTVCISILWHTTVFHTATFCQHLIRRKA